MKATALAVLLAVAVLGGVRSSSTANQVTRHQAKARTFAALLRITERAPDVADATLASITVDQCKRVGSGWLCHGSLYPVAFSGIDGSTCPIVVIVYPHSTHVRESQCV